MGKIVWFMIPIRSKALSRDWSGANRLLQNCLRSVLNQTDGRFRIIISCAEQPDLGTIADDRIEIISRNYDLPRTFDQMADDKFAKIRVAAAHVAREGGGYLMRLDSDDLVSSRIVQHVLSDDNRAGYIFESGMVLYQDSKKLKKIESFYNRCGSSFIIYSKPEQLPATEQDFSCVSPIFCNHRFIREEALARGSVLEDIPFPGAIYLLETGMNMSDAHPKLRRWSRRVPEAARRVWRRYTRPELIDDAIRNEFTLEI